MGDDERKSSWNARSHYIVLAALGGTVAATVVVITISVVLRPAHVEITVARATRSSFGDGTGGQYLNLTVTARSTSAGGRARVKYRSVFVDLKASSRVPGVTETIRASVDTALPSQFLPPGAGGTMSIKASVPLVGNSQQSRLAGRADNIGVTVVVTAQVLFKIGLVHTRVYDIIVSCPRVQFQHVSQTTSPVLCTG